MRFTDPDGPSQEGTSSECAQAVKKPQRGRPKDEHGPKKPKNVYCAFSIETRKTLQQTCPDLCSDWTAMNRIIADQWATKSVDWKAAQQNQFEQDMAVWRREWEVYKQTANYKCFQKVLSDWRDKKRRKKLAKDMCSLAPTRPRNAYMRFTDTIRDTLWHKVKEKGGGLKELGTEMRDSWNQLSEAAKASFYELAQKAKIEYDEQLATYKAGTQFAEFFDAKAKLEASQKKRKLARETLDLAPRRPPSAYALYREEVAPEVMKEKKNKKQGDGKLSRGELGKSVAAQWKNAPADLKAKYQEKAEPLKADYDTKRKDFMGSSEYMRYIEGKKKIDLHFNHVVNLREKPKRPKSVFLMFAKDHKDKVPAGKGEGKGFSALRQMFNEIQVEEREKYQTEQQTQTEAWQKSFEEFKLSAKYLKFGTDKQKIVATFKKEAIKVTTLKYLISALTPPFKSGFAIFVDEKKRAGPLEEMSTQEKKAKLHKLKEEWLQLEVGSKREYVKKHNELLKEYEEKFQKFMDSDKGQEYKAEAKRLKIPLRSGRSLIRMIRMIGPLIIL